MSLIGVDQILELQPYPLLLCLALETIDLIPRRGQGKTRGLPICLFTIQKEVRVRGIKS